MWLSVVETLAFATGISVALLGGMPGSATPEYSEENVDESRLVMIKRVMIGRGPFLLVFILTLIPQFAHYSFSADSFEQFIFWLDMVLTIIVASVIDMFVSNIIKSIKKSRKNKTKR